MVIDLTEFKRLWDSVTQGLTHEEKVIASFALVIIVTLIIVWDANSEKRKMKKAMKSHWYKPKKRKR